MSALDGATMAWVLLHIVAERFLASAMDRTGLIVTVTPSGQVDQLILDTSLVSVQGPQCRWLGGRFAAL